MPEDSRGGVQPERVAFGAVLMLLGLAIFAQRLGLVHWESYWRLWPLAMVGLGIVKMAYPKRKGRGEGASLIFVGLLLLGQSLGVLPFRQSWPLFIIWAGGSVIWNALRESREKRDGH